jgi:hypothetical protein
MEAGHSEGTLLFATFERYTLLYTLPRLLRRRWGHDSGSEHVEYRSKDPLGGRKISWARICELKPHDAQALECFGFHVEVVGCVRECGMKIESVRLLVCG